MKKTESSTTANFTVCGGSTISLVVGFPVNVEVSDELKLNQLGPFNK